MTAGPEAHSFDQQPEQLLNRPDNIVVAGFGDKLGRKLGEALTGGVDTVVETTSDALGDAAEKKRLLAPLGTLADIQDYFDKDETGIRSLGAMDIYMDSEETLFKLKRVNGILDQGRKAVAEITNSSLRFSPEFLRPATQKLAEAMKDSQGTSMEYFRKTAESDNYFAKKLVPDNAKDIVFEINQFNIKAAQLKQDLEGLVDPTIIDDPSNSMALNLYFKANDKVHNFREMFNKIKDWVPGL